MEVTIKNTIKIGQEIEKVLEVHQCERFKKENALFLTYQNSENEKVILKLTKSEFVMSRYSSPKSVMTFHKDRLSDVAIPTPLGYQYFQTKCHSFDFYDQESTLKISYDLIQRDTEELFASYRLEISWE